MKDQIKEYAAIYEAMCKDGDCGESEQVDEAFNKQQTDELIDQAVDVLTWVKSGKSLSDEDKVELKRIFDSLEWILIDGQKGSLENVKRVQHI